MAVRSSFLNLRSGFGPEAGVSARGLLLLNLLVVLATAAALWQGWRVETRDAERSTMATTRLLERNTAQTLDKIALLLEGAADQLEEELKSGGIRREHLWELVDRHAVRVGEVQTLAVFDSNGQQVCGTRPAERCRFIDVADRESFKSARTQQDTSPQIHGPLSSRLDKQPALTMTRPLRHADGAFAGVVKAVIPVDRLGAVLQATRSGDASAASLRTLAMTLVVRDPPMPAGAAPGPVSQKLSTALAQQPEGGSYRARTGSDGVDRYTAYQREKGWPLYVLVGSAFSDVLATWRSAAFISALFLLVFAAGSYKLAQAEARRRDLLRTQALMLDIDLIGMARLRNRHIVWANAGMSRLLGYSEAEFNGMPMRLLYPDDATFERIGLESYPILSSGRFHRVEVQMRHKDGRLRWMDAGGSPLSPGAAEILMTLTDITDRKQAEAMRIRAVELQANNSQLIETNRLKDEFLANMSHELRTPLNGILGFGQLLPAAIRSGDSDKLQRYTQQIMASGKQLLDLVQSQLDFARVEAGKMGLEFSLVELPPLLQELVGSLSPKAAALQLQLSAECASDLATVTADSARLRQLLGLLLDNALKFSRPGGSVTLRALADGADHWCIEVADDGIGIAAEDHAKIFENYTQLSAGTTKNYGGAGMGLALARQLARAMGGDIGVRSQPGAGAVFSLRLPRVPAAFSSAG